MLNVYQNLIGRMTFKTYLLVIAVILSLFYVKNIKLHMRNSITHSHKSAININS